MIGHSVSGSVFYMCKVKSIGIALALVVLVQGSELVWFDSEAFAWVDSSVELCSEVCPYLSSTYQWVGYFEAALKLMRQLDLNESDQIIFRN